MIWDCSGAQKYPIIITIVMPFLKTFHSSLCFVRLFGSLILASLFMFVGGFGSQPAQAAEGEVLGIHILHPYELDRATELLKPESSDDDQWHYVTVPFALDQLKNQAEWQDFFNKARDKKVIPLVRLVTKYENGAWQVPNKWQIAQQISFLSALDWPTDERHIIVFNEPNQAHEWAGQIDPAGYAQVLEFTARWAKNENKGYKVLPAGMDLAAPHGPRTAEAFWYLDQMLAENPAVFDSIDYWNSHSYPNPGFVSSPERTDKQSLRGFEHELTYLKKKTGRDFEVYITETGWRETAYTRPWLPQYYQYALQHVWSDARVKAVTPFVLQGDPGPFAAFTFIDQVGNQTLQYQAYHQLVKQLAEAE